MTRLAAVSDLQIDTCWCRKISIMSVHDPAKAQETRKIRLVPRDSAGRSFDVIPHDERLRGEFGEYIADAGLINAANTALALERPLLLTGEPGCGKSDFAWVAARALGGEELGPLCCYIRSDTRARDLLYHYDALRRFGDAQYGQAALCRDGGVELTGATARNQSARSAAADPRSYIRLRPLGVALMTAGRREVVLIDEIDKAPRDLPNDLLHVLDAGTFEIAELDGSLDGQPHADHCEHPLKRKMGRPEGCRKPLVVITSNAERQLPEPFLRRCIFYPIPPPSRLRLLEIARARLGVSGDGNSLAERLTVDLKQLVYTFAALRKSTEEQRLIKAPTTAEMIEWLRACVQIYRPEDIRSQLRKIVDSVDFESGRIDHTSGCSWADLPGISCLIKHSEDLRALR